MDSPISRTISVASSAVQKLARLQVCLALGIACLSGCASKLVDLDALGSAPKEFDQKISDIPSDKIVDQSQEVAPTDVKRTKTSVAMPAAVKPVTPDLKPVKGAKKTTAAATSFIWKSAAWPYGVGEVAEYSLRYGVIEGGSVEMKVLEPQTIEGEKAIHYAATVKSTRLLELFYHVDDTIDTWVSMDSHLPVRQEIQQRESAVWGTRVVTFDTKNQKSKFYSTTEGKGRKKKVERINSRLDHHAQEIFSSLYFFRFVNPRDRVNFAIHDKGKNWNNETTYINTETLNLPVGKIRARHYKLQPRISGHLQTKGDVEGWFADDDTRILVKFKANLKVGAISGDLRKYQPGQKILVEPPKMRTPIDLTSLGEAQKR